MLRPVPPRNAPSQLLPGPYEQVKLNMRMALHQLGYGYDESGGTEYTTWQIQKDGIVGRAAIEKKGEKVLLTVGIGKDPSVFSTVEGKNWELSRDLLDKLLIWLKTYEKQQQREEE